MRILISIDDTDNLDSPGTGALASRIAAGLESNGWGKSSFVTRHQLLVHPDIPYTSHNSSMCFAAEIDEAALEPAIHFAAALLAQESVAGSDPGLCVAVVDRLASPEPLILFGQKAKHMVATTAEAYALAGALQIHLTEHGGNGQGVIGALAGAGLRLSGNDGRIRGHLEIAGKAGWAAASEICSYSEVDEVRSLEGRALNGSERVKLGEKVKAVMLEGKSVLLVTPFGDAADGPAWQTCSRQQLRSY